MQIQAAKRDDTLIGWSHTESRWVERQSLVELRGGTSPKSIRFCWLRKRACGLSLMAKTAIQSHAPSLFSLAPVQCNGSGQPKNLKDLAAGVALCAQAATLGYVDALCELGHCLQDGYGVHQDISRGWQLLILANLRVSFNYGDVGNWPSHVDLPIWSLAYALLSDFGCNVPIPEVHPVNRLTKELFKLANTR
ncbi:hypothetical protein NL676_026531 [Syzygium grande]|nr:hypothetical protein NL676_026531 [Syzygium grande]